MVSGTLGVTERGSLGTRVAVTGGSGFIGSNVVDALHAAGNEVVVIDQLASHRDDVEHRPVDILDAAAMQKATEDVSFLFHLAAVADVGYAFKNPLQTIQLNITGTANALEAARQNKLERVVLASTVWVYSGCEETEVNEETSFLPTGPGHVYSTSKIAAEYLCQDYWKLYEQPFTVLRYGIPYGPRMRDNLVMATFLRKALAGEPITIAGDGLQYRNFVYVGDLARAHVLAMSDVAKNQTYNLEGTEKITIKAIADAGADIVEGPVSIEHTPARPGDYEGKMVSAQKAKDELGWVPEVDFSEGLRLTTEWYRATHS